MKAITSSEEFTQIITSNNKVLVDFWAPWCGPCRTLIPILESLSELQTDTVFIKVNADESWASDLVNYYAVSSLPTLILFNSGKIEGRLVGSVSRPKILELLS